MQTVTNILRSLSQEFSQIAANMDTGSWIGLTAVVVVAGIVMLRGSALHGA